MYLTRLDDSQLSFGSGSSINADDIPNGTTNFFLTKGAQSISGSKFFSNKITDNASGSSFRTLTILQDELIAGNLDVNGNIKVDADGPGGTYGSFIYFSKDDAWLKYYGSPIFALATNRDFGCNKCLTGKVKLTIAADDNTIEFVNGVEYPSRIRQVTSTQPLYISTEGSDLYLGTTADFKALTIHNNRSILGPYMTTFSGSTVCTGNISANGKVLATTTSGSMLRTLSTLGNTHIGGALTSIGNIKSYGNMYVDADNGAGLAGAIIYFGGTDANLKWIGSPVNGFLLSKGIAAAGTITASSGNITVTAGTVTASANSGSIFKTLTAYGNIQSQGTLIGNRLKLNITPTTETIIPDKTITISLNNVNYKIPVKAA